MKAQVYGNSPDSLVSEVAPTMGVQGETEYTSKSSQESHHDEIVKRIGAQPASWRGISAKRD